MMTHRTCYQTLCAILAQAQIPEPQQEVGFLLEHLTGMPLPRFLMDSTAETPPALAAQAQSLCHRRAAGEPLQYLLGEWDFFGLTFSVGTGVLIPRADTETLVEEVLRLRKGCPTTRMVDLCSGSGCIPSAIAAYLPNVSGMAIERESAAFSYLKKNLQQHAVQVLPVQGDVLQASLAATCTNYHILTCNPPYLTQTDMQQLQPEVAFEPETALYGGTDGLDFYRQVTALWKTALAAGGWLVYEIGQGQEQDVTDLLQAHGFSHITQRADASGIIRMVAGQR
jgi:release factor glutamine methyltransferase